MDDDFIEPARRGDSEAFRQIMTIYHPLIWRTACALLADRALAEDACQEIWIDVWRGLATFTAGQAFRPWLLTIAAHRCHKLLRQRYTSQASVAAAFIPDRADPTPPMATVFQSETRQELYRAITLLPREQQQVITLRYFADLDLANGSAPSIAYFDTSASKMTGSTLSLHLTLAKFTAADDVNNAPTYTPIIVSGPFHFDYTTPFYAGQTIDTRQTMTDHGKAVTLERVVITPSAAQAYLRLSFPITDDEKFTGRFIAPNGVGNLGTHGGVGLHESYDPATGIAIMTSVQVSSQSPGQWSLGVNLSQLDQVPNPAGGKPTNDGTLLAVTFTFVVT